MKNKISYLIESENLTFTQFAEKIGVQRSAVSHLTSGRNKPSLDVIQKILTSFKHLNPDWLLLDKEPMYREEKEAYIIQNSSNLFDKEEKTDSETFKEEENPVYKTPINMEKENKSVKKIIIFYSDNTFEEFTK